jgi:hypothetical protein
MTRLATSAAAHRRSTDKSVCATTVLPFRSIRGCGRMHVAQTLLSVLVMLGTIEEINTAPRSHACR